MFTLIFYWNDTNLIPTIKCVVIPWTVNIKYPELCYSIELTCITDFTEMIGSQMSS